MNPTESTTPPPFPEPPYVLPEKPDLRTLFEALLRQPKALVERLARPGHGAVLSFAAIAIVSFALFGFVLGCFAKYEQLWAAPVKVTGGLVFASIICFPSLYIFTTLAGSRMSLSQLLAVFAGTAALAGLLLLGFAPAVWIFAESTDSFGFMGMLGLAAWAIALIFGLRFLTAATRHAGATGTGPIVIWSIVFALVTLQLTTSLRPILGRSEKQFLTQEKKFFLQHWNETSGKSLPKSTPKPSEEP